MDSALQDQAARGRAALPGRPERPPEHALERKVEIGIVQHDLGVLAAHLEGQTFVHPTARLADNPARFGRSGERDHRNSGMFDECRAHRLAATVDQLNDLRRQARLEEDLHQHRGGVRDVLGGLEDDCVSAQERGKGFPGGNGEREVERRHETTNAHRAAKAHCPLRPELARHRVAEEAPPLRRRIVRGVDPLLNVATRLRQRLAHLAGHEVRDLFFSAG